MGTLTRISLGIVALSSVAMTACGDRSDAASEDQYAHVIAFDTARVRLVSGADTLMLTVELAATPDQHSMGLMERRELPSEAGMLFLYPAVQSDSASFWMFRTRIPLDIAFIDSTGVIKTIRGMVPCTSGLAGGCPNYVAGARFVAALEVNAGWFARKGIRVGDRLVLQDTTAARR